MTEEQENFLKLVAPAALKAEDSVRIPAAVIVAQAILESGWGKSRLFKEANNPFGIKNLDLPDDYGEYRAPTTEFKNGKPYPAVAEFEKFRSLDDAFFHHAILFWRSKRYWPAVDAWLRRGNAFEFARLIGPAGYATDPQYGNKLANLIHQFKLASRANLHYYAGASAASAAAGKTVEGTDI